MNSNLQVYKIDENGVPIEAKNVSSEEAIKLDDDWVLGYIDESLIHPRWSWDKRLWENGSPSRDLMDRLMKEKKQAEHLEKRQLAEKLIMDRMVSDYILSTDLADEEKDIFINLFDLWEPNTAYSIGDKLVYEGVAYEVIQAHTSQSDWLPSDLPALYSLFYQTSTDDGTVVIPEWVQPLGAHDAYNKWDLVSYDGYIWESDVDGNIWKPGEYGWTQVEETK